MDEDTAPMPLPDTRRRASTLLAKAVPQLDLDLSKVRKTDGIATKLFSLVFAGLAGIGLVSMLIRIFD